MLLLREMPFEHFLEIFLSTAARNFSKCPLKCPCAFPETAREYEYGTWQYQVRLKAGSWGTGVWSFSRLKTIPNFSAWSLLQALQRPASVLKAVLKSALAAHAHFPPGKPCCTAAGWPDLCWGPSSYVSCCHLHNGNIHAGTRVGLVCWRCSWVAACPAAGFSREAYDLVQVWHAPIKMQ